MMKLYYSPNSPFVRKVRITAIEKGLMDNIECVLSSPMENKTDLHAANPLGKIPALVLENGETIFDSPVICEYLDGLSATNPLLPLSAAARLKTRKSEALADGIMDACVARFLEFMRPENERSPKWIERWENAIKRSLDVLESGKEPLPDSFDLGAIALVSALGYVDLRYELNWKETHPKTAQWFGSHAQRKSVSETMPVK
jgi:glutathione S-transferase